MTAWNLEPLDITYIQSFLFFDRHSLQPPSVAPSFFGLWFDLSNWKAALTGWDQMIDVAIEEHLNSLLSKRLGFFFVVLPFPFCSVRLNVGIEHSPIHPSVHPDTSVRSHIINKHQWVILSAAIHTSPKILPQPYLTHVAVHTFLFPSLWRKFLMVNFPNNLIPPLGRLLLTLIGGKV